MKRAWPALLGLLALVWLLPAQARDTVYYYYTNTVHSAVVETDAQGNVIERTYYAPYGQVLNRTMRDGPGYGGHEEDPATGLNYMQQRYYDPQSGRFLSTDPVEASANGGNFNRYWYAKDNPYRYTDPDGRWADTDFSAGQGTRAYAADILAHPNRPLTPVDKAILAIGAAVAGTGEAEVAATAVRAVVGYVTGRAARSIVREAVSGKRTNKVEPIKNASGPHTTWKTDPKTGEITRHETWTPNARNPSGWDSKQSTDLRGVPHTNKQTGESIPTPHTQGKSIPGGVRPATPNEVPKRLHDN